ncbi:hypothetical protein B0H13DRAFT_2270904 [Mycena leptocephala]|nr:hypothetical protein B0H13DRAFT_2270904 [Mycena leptocephala]
MIVGDSYTPPPPTLLGVYASVAIPMMKNRPYDWHWRHVIRELDARALFALSLQSRDMLKIVLAFVHETRPTGGNTDEGLAGGPDDMLSRLPLHVFPLIFASTSMCDRISLGRTSRKLRAICARELQAAVHRVLQKFNLSHTEIRFMQTATMTLISGPLIAHLTENSLSPSHLDFYVPNGNFSAVMRFFHLATLYEGTSNTYTNGCVGEESISTLYRPYAGKYLRVIQSRTDSAKDCTPYAPFSHLFGCISHCGVWLGYPRTMTTGISFFNRDSIAVENPLMRYHLILNLADYVGRFRFCFFWGGLHTCGVDFECPATPRSTDDRGCLNIFFPNAPHNSEK